MRAVIIKKMFLLIAVTFVILTTSIHRASSSSVCEIITRDVCVIGGGSSGTFAAVQLQKVGRSVVVVEKENFLGGHTHTYTDPNTNIPIDYGVAFFENLPVVIDYFDHLQVPWNNVSAFQTNAVTYFDFSTSKIMSNVTIPSPAAGLQSYVAEMIKYLPLQRGFYLPNPIPDDLLLPLGEFADKYNLGVGAVNLILRFSQGIGDILKLSTLYVLKIFGLNVVTKDLVDGFIVPKDYNNSNIYSNAYKMLTSDNVLLQSRPIRVQRTTGDSVQVIVKTPAGLKLIKAKKLLVTIPPHNLSGFDLNVNEARLFSQFRYSYYFTGLIRNTGLPANAFVENINLRNAYYAPTLPGLYFIRATAVTGIFDVKYCSPRYMSEEAVKADILASIDKLRRVGVAEKNNSQVMLFKNHSPFALTVSPEEIRAGFYKKLYDLQGARNTFWTGATWNTQNSGLLWQFTQDVILPDLIAAL